MGIENKMNFFDFATKEISHSSFWAWLIAQLGRQQQYQTQIAALLNVIFFDGEEWFSGDQQWDVTREAPLPGAGRIDVLAKCEQHHLVFGIENKIKAQACEAQIERYRKAMCEQSEKFPQNAVHVAFVDTGFDFENAHSKIVKHCGLIVDLQRLATIWKKLQLKGDWPYLVNEYFSWIMEQHKRLEETRQILTTDDIRIFTEAVCTSEGQCILMNWIADQQSHRLIDPNIVQVKLPLTRNGLPTTEYWFYNHEPESCYWRGLFFRLDAEPRGKFECTLRFYTETNDSVHLSLKMDLLEKLKCAVKGVSGVKQNTSPKRTKNSHRVCAIDIKELAAIRPDMSIAILLNECFSQIIEAVLPLMPKVALTIESRSDHV